MSCLKPPLKNVPKGDWFCKDCRPVMVKRRSRKHSKIQVEEETEEEVWALVYHQITFSLQGIKVKTNRF